MKVSVLMFVYNQEKYVAEAIESALGQKTDFSYEIVIGEDCSTDKTRNIVKDYQNRYPDTIKLVLQPNNLGLMKNFMQTLKACSGQYIAMLAGDDYWTDTGKLQKQADFLDGHPDFSLCFHNVKTIGNGLATLLCPPGQKIVSGLEDILLKNFIPAVSVMFRKKFFGDFPDWYKDLEFEDWPLFVLCAEQGKIGYLKEVMAGYRVHAASVTGNILSVPEKYTRHLKDIIEFYQAVNKHLNFRYSLLIQKMIAAYELLLAEHYFPTDKKIAWRYVAGSLKHYRRPFWLFLFVKRIGHYLLS